MLIAVTQYVVHAITSNILMLYTTQRTALIQTTNRSLVHECESSLWLLISIVPPNRKSTICQHESQVKDY